MHDKPPSSKTTSANTGITRLTADIVIVGGFFSTPAAALQAARSWPTARVLVIEPTDWLGGQATSQGVPAMDEAGSQSIVFPFCMTETSSPTDEIEIQKSFPDFANSYQRLADPLLASKGLSPSLEKAAPFYIPYRSLASHNVRNLIVGGKLIAGTYLTNAAYRLHPIEWAIGSAAGAAAALMAKDRQTNYELLKASTLRRLQEEISRNSPIQWTALHAYP